MAFGRKAWNVNAVSAAIYVSTVLTLESSLFKLKKTNNGQKINAPHLAIFSENGKRTTRHHNPRRSGGDGQ
ncbi:MAG: hypothetical protein ACO210_00450 [Sediminibacterium sp.]